MADSSSASVSNSWPPCDCRMISGNGPMRRAITGVRLLEGLDKNDAEGLEAHRRDDQRQRVPIVVLELCRVDPPEKHDSRVARRQAFERGGVIAVAGDEQIGVRVALERGNHIVETLDAFEASDKQKIRASDVESAPGFESPGGIGFGRKYGSTSMSCGKPNSRCLSRLNSLMAMNTSTWRNCFSRYPVNRHS